MSDLSNSERRERARALAEQALDLYAQHNRKEADRLAEEAARLDRGAVEELLREIDEDGRVPDEDEE